MNIEFFSPSYRRPVKSITQTNYPFVKLVVCKSEAAAYKKAGNDIIVIPDKVQGSAPRVRNYILDMGAEKSLDATILMDDDVQRIAKWIEQESVTLSADELLEFAEISTIMAYDAGVELWGLNPGGCTDKGTYREHTPFGLISMVLGPFMAHLKTNIRFDERLPLKEDYDLSIQHLWHNRKILRFNAYHYDCKQAEQAGGCAVYRNTDTEKHDFELLQQKWGSKIIQRDSRSKREFDFNPIIKIPIKGV